MYANRGTFYVSRYHLGADEQARLRTVRVNVEKGYVADHSGEVTYGQSGAATLDAMSLTDLDLSHESRITEDENLRFSMPVLILGRLRKCNRGGSTYRIGDQQEVSHVRGQGIELVNLGESGRAKQGDLGHLICTVCGQAKTPYAVPQEIAQFERIHRERCGKDVRKVALSVQAEVDTLQFHSIVDEATAINIGESLRTAATRLLDMGPNDLQLLVIQRPDETFDLLVYDPMPGGSGLLEQILSRWEELMTSAQDILIRCSQSCDTACYSCLKSFQNQFHHEMLNRHLASQLISQLTHTPQKCRDIAPAFEDERGDIGSPSNSPEAKLLRLLNDYHFPSGECRKRILTSIGVQTEPDWIHSASKVAVYLDGMSRGLHGDPKIASRDQMIRMAMEHDDYKVIVVQKRDLDDPQAVWLHLKSIADAIGISIRQ